MSGSIRYFLLSLVLLLSGLATNLLAQEIIPDEIIIDYTAIDKPLREVIFDLSQEAEITVAFQEEILPGDSLINFSVKEQKIGVVLNYLLERHFVKYKIIGDQIVLYKDPYRKSENEITISGYLRDLESGESLISANVYTYDQSSGTVSNEYGFYSFTIPKGLQRLHYSYLGYNTNVQELSLTKDTVINVMLDPVILLNEIIITDTRIAPITTEFKIADTEDLLPIQRLNSFLPAAGEPDPITSLVYFLFSIPMS